MRQLLLIIVFLMIQVSCHDNIYDEYYDKLNSRCVSYCKTNGTKILTSDN